MMGTLAAKGLIDAVFFALVNNPPNTFKGIAQSILNQITGCSGNEINFVAGKWLTRSVKDIEYINRDAVSTTYKVSEASQMEK